MSEKVMPGKAGQIHIPFDAAARPHYLDRAVAALGKGGHCEVDRDAAVQFDVYDLMIDDVVVAVIDASSVRAGAQGALDGFGRGIGIEHVDGPVYPAGADAGAFPFQIIPDEMCIRDRSG